MIFTESCRIADLYCDAVMYEGQCRDLYEDGLCALGERLFLRNGAAQCDCLEVESSLVYLASVIIKYYIMNLINY